MNSYDGLTYAAEYWRLDGEAQQRFAELCPEAQGECVSLSDLDTLCRLMGRPIRDDTERVRLMTELDTTNQMTVLRHDFVTWLLEDMARERELEDARLYVRVDRPAPVAKAAWEEVVVASDAADYVTAERRIASSASDPSALSSYYYNVLTGESKWDLPQFAQCLWSHVTTVEAKRTLTVPDPHDAVLLRDDHTNNVETLQDLRALFVKYDDDGSGSLDSAEFEDLCVAIGLSLSRGSGERASLRTLMRDVDPFSAQEIVSWDAFSYYWTVNTPFQRRTRLSGPFAAWERIDALHKKNVPVAFRNADTLAERWNHPEMEQNVVALLLKVVPSTKIEWATKVALFFEAQLDGDTTSSSSTTTMSDKSSESGVKLDAGRTAKRLWGLPQCGRVLLQLGHPMTRKRHLEAAVQRIREQFSGDEVAKSNGSELSEDTVTAWLLYCVRKVEMDGWEELVDPTSGQVYYYHDVSGATQWDPPEMESHMSQFLHKFGSDSSSDERITRIFRHYDVDESGSISFDEFRQFYRALVLGTADASTSSFSGGPDELKIRQLFSVLDTGGDSSVSLDEFKLWWRTKLQLEEVESAGAANQRRVSQRRELCRTFLESVHALDAREPDAVSQERNVPTTDDELVCFASNLLPRVVAVLGKYPLRGLAYRNALNALVKDAVSQEVQLEDFLVWYDGFEAAEREKEALEDARAKAKAAIQAQELKAKARATEKLRITKRKRVLAVGKEQPNAQHAEDAKAKRIETLFRAFDTNNSGFLDASELAQLTNALGHAMDPDQVRQMLQVMDSSGDGQVTLAEFTTFWTAFQRTQAPVTTATSPTRTSVLTSDPEPVLAPRVRKHRTSTVDDASAALAVSVERAKTRLLKFSLDDFREALGDWKDELADKRREKQKQKSARQLATREATRRRSIVFVPIRKRWYGASLDVTHIEPDIVACVADMIQTITRTTRPLLRPDAAQTIQKLARAFVTRQYVRRLIDARFVQAVDLHTRHFYYVDCEHATVVLARPLFRFERTSSVPPFEFDDCDTKRERYEFHKRTREMQAKQQFFEHNGFASALAGRQRRPHYAVAAAFYLFDVAQLVHRRLLGDIWGPLRQKRDVALVELIATRHRRQLRQRSSDGAAYLPLHFVVRHFRAVFPLRVVVAVANGFPDVLTLADAFGMTPLHLAVWAMKTRCGDTPVHTGVQHRAPIELMRWILLRSRSVSTTTLSTLNARGFSPFHVAIRLLHSNSVGGSSTVVAYATALLYAFLKRTDASQLCATRTKRGDLPLHLAMDAFQRASVRDTHARDGFVWATELLMRRYPLALLVRRADSGLLPIHLAIQFGFPADIVASMWQTTRALLTASSTSGRTAASDETIVLETTTITQTRMTLLHYAVLHRPHALELIQSIVEATPTATKRTCAMNANLPLHLAVGRVLPGVLSTADASSRRCRVVQLLCEQYAAGCQVYNRQGQLPLHVALASSQSVEIVQTLLATAPYVLSTNPQERNGLCALVLAASQRRADYAVLRELVEHAPASACTAVLTTMSVKFEQVEDDDAYFLAMARAKMRRKHHCPTPAWDFRAMLRLIDLNPVDDAVVQRALLAISHKLQTLGQQTSDRTALSASHAGSSAAEATVAAIALDPDLAIVRRVHHVLFEFPANARVQVVGQSVLRALLPTAFAKATYKAKIDPYFNL